tara:strand:- start:43 stop:492 length:450 start_codon:yes stop_codon:yes gene_type:complete
MKYLILISVSIFTFSCSQQNPKKLDQSLEHQKNLNSLEIEFQKKIDTGIGIVFTVSEYNNQIDSLLNVVYQSLNTQLTKEEIVKLKLDQQDWINIRDFKIDSMQKPLDSLFDSGLHIPTDSRLINLDADAQFVKKRIEVLIKKLHTTQN